MTRRPRFHRPWPALLAIALGCVPKSISAEPTFVASSRRELTELARQYKIEFLEAKRAFRFDRGSWTMSGTPARDKDMAGYVALFMEEFSLYPPELVRRAGVGRIVLCDGLAVSDKRRAAIPDFRAGDLYLDVTGTGASNWTYCRKVLHHEFFHLVDHSMNWRLGNDERWSMLNPPKFGYGNGGASA